MQRPCLHKVTAKGRKPKGGNSEELLLVVTQTKLLLLVVTRTKLLLLVVTRTKLMLLVLTHTKLLLLIVTHTKFSMSKTWNMQLKLLSIIATRQAQVTHSTFASGFTSTLDYFIQVRSSTYFRYKKHFEMDFCWL